MPNFSARLFSLQRAMGLRKKDDLAKLLGVSRTMLYLYEKGEPAPPAELLLTLGKLESEHGIEPTFTHGEPYPIIPTGSSGGHREIPVIGWAHAGEAASYEELPQEWQDRIPTECKDEHAFAVRLEGESMEPKFSEGDLLILQPSKEAYNGCLAVCKFRNNGVVFRRVEFTPDAVRLVALNPAYPTDAYDRDAFTWIYPVWGRWTQVWK